MKSNKAIKMIVKKEDVPRSSSYIELEERRALSKKDVSIDSVSGQEYASPIRLFRHEDLTGALENAKVIDETSLANTLNHIHFMDGHFLVQLRHPKYDESVLIKARPDPCLGSELVCHFADENLAGINLKGYKILNLIIDDGQSVIFVPAILNRMDNESFSVQLPQKSYAVEQRRTRRHLCEGVDAELVQGGRLIKGKLLDFSPKGFRICVPNVPARAFDWSSRSDVLTMLQLRRDQKVLFSGPCYCVRRNETPSFMEVVLTSSEDQAKRSDRKQIRNPARNVYATPVIIFEHPLLGKKIQLDVSDISTSGFSVYEKDEEEVLIQGMIIPELTIEFAGAVKIRCSAQIIYRLEEDRREVRSGFAILDMDIDSYTRLVHILANSIDPYSRVSNKVDMDALWEFFFETGFIYPKKYGLIQSQKEEFKETYRRLYNDNPDIARHFVYQRNGRLYAHISMVRAYERAWMIHHHAARNVEGRRAGFAVLKQIVLYLNDMHRLPSTKIDHMMVYFRPENKFPDRVFGGFARSKENIGVCSMDLFCYLPYHGLSIAARLPEGWSLSDCSATDLWELNLFYRNHSGGLLMDALSLTHRGHSEESFEEAYRRLGFLRKWRAYSLKRHDELVAVLIVNRSDLGFNLSELLNGIKVLAINPEDLSWSILSNAIGQLVREHRMEKIPVLFYPFGYVQAKDIPYEKQYQLWIYDARSVGQFVEYMKRKFRIKDW
ncbi:MAG: PilZ domain-containing protein [Pseudomonadota bacterium]